MEKDLVIEKKFELPNKKVKVTPVRRKGGWLPLSHEASFLFKDAKKEYCVPIQSKDRPIRILSDEEEQFLSNKLRTDLSVYKEPKDNFWLKHKVQLNKEIKILDLSDPLQYIDFKILMSLKDEIAPSGDQKFDKGTYKYFIDDIDYTEKKLSTEAKSKERAYKVFGKLSVSNTNMKDFLGAYFLNKPGRHIPLNASTEWLEGELGSIIENDLDGFLVLSEDVYYEQKTLLAKAIAKKAIIKSANNYTLPEGDVIATNIKDALIWLKDEKNNEEVIKITLQIED